MFWIYTVYPGLWGRCCINVTLFFRGYPAPDSTTNRTSKGDNNELYCCFVRGVFVIILRTILLKYYYKNRDDIVILLLIKLPSIVGQSNQGKNRETALFCRCVAIMSHYILIENDYHSQQGGACQSGMQLRIIRK
jgi:hypothetical protein